MVRFSDLPTILEAPSQHHALDSQAIWYTGTELRAQLGEAMRPIQRWQDDGYQVLIHDSYRRPHIYTQEYLNAYCREQDYHVRGLEMALEAEHKQERSSIRKLHRQAILDQQLMLKSLFDLAFLSNELLLRERLSQTSRESSSPSKLFAMRLGRADAQVAEQGSDPSAAKEIVHSPCDQRKTDSDAENDKYSSGSQCRLAASFVGLEMSIKSCNQLKPIYRRARWTGAAGSYSHFRA